MAACAQNKGPGRPGTWAGCFGTQLSLTNSWDGKIKVYGSGVISSHGECTNVIDGGCGKSEISSLNEVLAAPVKVDSIHKLLFAIETFDPNLRGNA